MGIVEKSLESLASDIALVKDKIAECDRMKEKSVGDQLERLDAKRTTLEAKRDRLALAMDIVSGRAYAIWDINNEPYVVKPKSEGTAKLIRAAEDYGARAVEITTQKELL